MGYQLSLNLKNKKVLIVGGGRVAFRKFKRLLQTEAETTVISLEFDPLFDEYFEFAEESYQLLKRPFNEQDLKDKFLLFAATDDRELNEKIAFLAGERGILVNIIDNAALSDFTVPAAYRKGKLVLTASTTSVLPALSRKIRKDFEKNYGIEYQFLLEIMEAIRPLIIKEVSDIELRKNIFRDLVETEFIADLKKLIGEYNLTEKDIESKSAVYDQAAAELLNRIKNIIELNS